MAEYQSEELAHAVVAAYARTLSLRNDPEAAYRSGIAVLLRHNLDLSPEEAADRLLAMIFYATSVRPEWLRVERQVTHSLYSLIPARPESGN